MNQVTENPLETLKKTLKRLNHEFLIPYTLSWTKNQLLEADRELNSINLAPLKEQRELIQQDISYSEAIMEVVQKIHWEDQMVLEGSGQKLLSQGKVGCILVAGGQGTRLGYSGPKGCFPITPVKQKTLFQYFTEKLLAASRFANCQLQLAIMTSSLNHRATLNHFDENHFFGASKEQIHFFKQESLPFLDKAGNLFFELPGKVAQGPNGNGSAIHAFYNAGLGKVWEDKGIEYVTFIMIDNPLADPFDLKLLETHLKTKADVTLKCIERNSSEEKVGIVAKVNQKIKVIEYSEVPVKTWGELNQEGRLRFSIANISLFCFSLSFLKRVSNLMMPMHKAYKNVLRLRKDQTIERTQGWKFEYFIFDILEFTNKTEILLSSRSDTFAPLKNAEGNNTPKAVQEALSQYDRKILAQITHQKVPLEVLEIDPAFHYPTETLVQKWKSKKLENTDFISAD